MIRCLLFILVVGVAAAATERPVVAVLTQPGAWCSELTCGGSPSSWAPQFIYASYVKWLEASGARVAVIQSDWPFAQIESMLRSVNGLLIPGGSDIGRHMNSTYTNVTRRIFHLAVSINVEEHSYFPVWGTCQGFDQLMIYSSSNEWDASAFAIVDAERLFLPLALTTGAERSFLLKEAPQYILETLQTNVTSNFHYWGLKPKTFAADEQLSAMYNILGTSFDSKGVEFVALAEGKVLPLFASQFHPEKNAFEWGDGIVSSAQSTGAILAMQWLGLRFIAACKNNSHAFVTPQAERAALIANHHPTFTGSRGGMGTADQTYIY